MSQVITKFKTTKEKVRYLLHKYPSARNSTEMCYLLFLKHFTRIGVHIPYIPQEEVKKVVPNPDSIARAIRFIQNTEKDPNAQPSPSVKRRRQKNETDFTEYFGKKE